MEKFEKYPEIFRIENQIKLIKKKISKNKVIIKDIRIKKRSNKSFKRRTKALYNNEFKKTLRLNNESIKEQFKQAQYTKIDLEKLLVEYNSSVEKLKQDTRQMIDIRLQKNDEEMKMIGKSYLFCIEDNKRLKEELSDLQNLKKDMWNKISDSVNVSLVSAKTSNKRIKTDIWRQKKLFRIQYKKDKKQIINDFKFRNASIKFVKYKLYRIQSKINIRNADKITPEIQELFIDINKLKRNLNSNRVELKEKLKASEDNIRYIEGKSDKYTINDFADKVNKFTNKLNSKPVISSITYSFIKLLPFVLFSSFVIVISNVFFSPVSGFMAIFNLSEGAKAGLNEFIEYLQIGRYASVGLFSLVLAALIGSTLSYTKSGNSHTASTLCVATTVMFSPMLTYYIFKYPSPEEASSVLQGVRAGFNEWGSMGIFMAIFTSIFTTLLYLKLSKVKTLQINIKSSNKNVSNSFRDLIIVVIVLGIFFGIQLLLFGFGELIGVVSINGVDDKLNTIPKLFKFVFSLLIQNPSNTYGGMFSYLLLTNALWVVGIEQSIFAEPFYNIQGNLLHENWELMQGLFPSPEQAPDPHIFTNFFNTSFINIGGQGMMLCLIIAILLFSKKQDAKQIALLSLIPAFFNISEPVMFGLPVIFNVIYGAGFVIAPLIAGSVAYILTYVGFMNLTHIANMVQDKYGGWGFRPEDAPFLNSMWIYPTIVQGYITTESVESIVVIFINIFIGSAVYSACVWFDNKSEIEFKSSDPLKDKIIQSSLKQTTVMRF